MSTECATAMPFVLSNVGAFGFGVLFTLIHLNFFLIMALPVITVAYRKWLP